MPRSSTGMPTIMPLCPGHSGSWTRSPTLNCAFIGLGLIVLKVLQCEPVNPFYCFAAAKELKLVPLSAFGAGCDFVYHSLAGCSWAGPVNDQITCFELHYHAFTNCLSTYSIDVFVMNHVTL